MEDLGPPPAFDDVFEKVSSDEVISISEAKSTDGDDDGEVSASEGDSSDDGDDESTEEIETHSLAESDEISREEVEVDAVADVNAALAELVRQDLVQQCVDAYPGEKYNSAFHLKKAAELRGAKQWDIAALHCMYVVSLCESKMCEERADHLEALKQLSFYELASGRKDLAELLLNDKILPLAPKDRNDAQAYMDFADYLDGINCSADASTFYLRVVDLYEDGQCTDISLLREALTSLYYVSRDLGDDKGARSWLIKSLAFDPYNPKVHHRCAIFERHCKNDDAENKHLEKVVELYQERKHEDKASAINALLRLYDKMRADKNFTQAEAYIIKMLAVDSQDPKIHERYGAFLFSHKRYQDALLKYLKARELGGSDEYSYYCIGTCFWRAGEVSKAKAEFLKGSKIPAAKDAQKGNSPLNEYLGVLLLEEADKKGKNAVKKAEKAANQYLLKAKAKIADDRLSSKSNVIKDVDRAVIAFRSQRWEIALKYCRKALKSDAENETLIKLEKDCLDEINPNEDDNIQAKKEAIERAFGILSDDE